MTSLEKITETKADAAKFMVDEITRVIKTCGKRPPGSKGEKDAVEHMGELLKTCADDVRIEPFDVRPGAFYGWIYISMTLMLLAVACLFFMPILSAAFVVGALCLFAFEFVLYRPFVDKLFKKRVSHNLTAIRKPKGETKRRIIMNGHPDAAWEWTVNYHLGCGPFQAHFLIAIAGCAYVLATAVAGLATKGVKPFVSAIDGYAVAAFVSLAFVPFFIGMYFLWNEKLVVDGANDNLTGCFIGIAVLKALEDAGIELENTELGVALTGSEEAGLRGAKAWAKAHKAECEDCETLIYAFDTIREARFLAVNERDMNCLVKADARASELFKNAAKELGIKCESGSIPFGSSDAAAFSQAGLKSVGITAMDHNLQPYYHTRRDTYDNLDEGCLADAFATMVKTIEDFDAGK